MKDFYRLMARPTIVISTISPRGISNAAPFSFCSPMASKPRPLFGFSCEVEHDTWRNIQQNGEFVVNLVGQEFGPLMEMLETHYPYEVSEIEKCGLTTANSSKVKPPRIAEAYGWIECRMREHTELSERSVWIIGEVLDSDAKEDLYDAGKNVIDVGKVKPLNHIWGDIFTEMTEIRFKRASK
jgi:flavin reductase (DIM6/NTAB) family NADH-FMN oxidoreductase RutF